MASRCDVCQKGPAAGKTISHSHKASNRRFLPNVRKVQVVVAGHTKRMNVCTRCLRTQRVRKPSRKALSV